MFPYEKLKPHTLDDGDTSGNCWYSGHEAEHKLVLDTANRRENQCFFCNVGSVSSSINKIYNRKFFSQSLRTHGKL